MNRRQVAEQFRRAVQMFAESLNDDRAMEVATIYDGWVAGKSYAAGDFVVFGCNGVGDPQLYKVAQAHTSQADWTPDVAAALFVAVGLDAAGYPVWSQPAGAQDAYQAGDVVSFQGTLYRSLVNGNVYSPQEYPGAWETYRME